MIRLIGIEWQKYKHYRIFWTLFFLYLILIVGLSASGFLFLNFLEKIGSDLRGFSPTIIPIYDFPDIWQNITYFATFFKIILAFLVIIFITNEYNYQTLRQNIIDGLSRNQFLIGKIGFVFILCLINTLAVFLTGLILGLLHSSVVEFKFIADTLEFIAVYLLDIFVYCLIAMIFASIFRKAGITIIILALISLFFDPFLAYFLQNFPKTPPLLESVTAFFPFTALNNLIRIPFPRYIFQEIQNYVALKDIFIVLGQMSLYLFLLFAVIIRRDL